MFYIVGWLTSVVVRSSATLYSSDPRFNSELYDTNGEYCCAIVFALGLKCALWNSFEDAGPTDACSIAKAALGLMLHGDAGV